MPDQGFIYRDFIARACKYLADILHIHFAELLGSLVGCIVASRYGLEHLARSLQSSQDGQHDTGKYNSTGWETFHLHTIFDTFFGLSLIHI